jgi:trk system potassium uptake protein TrkH
MTESKKISIRKKHPIFTAARIIVAGFSAIILLGAACLMLPFATKDGIEFLDALFTATSATCVTGLAVYQSFDNFTLFGKIVILLLIQIGGVGFMSVTSFVYMSFSKRLSLSTRLTLKEDIAEGNIRYIKRLITRIVIMTAVAETAGAIVLTGAFSRYMGAGEAVWNGVFHSISAYCNAGYDISADASGMTAYNSDPLVLLTLAALTIFGGIGFIVVSDIWDSKLWRKFRLHTKIVLGVTAALLVFGTAFFLGAEYNNPSTIGNMSFGDKLLNSFFMSASCRSAGFDSLGIENMSPPSRVCVQFLMFVGSSPSSTGGGIKTTTLFILIVMVFNVVRRRKYSVVDKQTIGYETVNKASTVLVLALINMLIAAGLLLISDGEKFTSSQLLFEQISAYATVGFSLGITGSLSVWGKLIIIASMFIGRVGVLTFFVSFTKGKASDTKITYPECQISV